MERINCLTIDDFIKACKEVREGEYSLNLGGMALPQIENGGELSVVWYKESFDGKESFYPIYLDKKAYGGNSVIEKLLRHQDEEMGLMIIGFLARGDEITEETLFKYVMKCAQSNVRPGDFWFKDCSTMEQLRIAHTNLRCWVRGNLRRICIFS